MVYYNERELGLHWQQLHNCTYLINNEKILGKDNIIILTIDNSHYVINIQTKGIIYNAVKYN